MNVIFVEPAFPANQREFVRALAQVGATVIGIGERPRGHLGEELEGWMLHYEQVPSVVHEEVLLEAVKRVQGRVWVDRIEATVEAHILPVANVRERSGIPGTSVRTAYLCRDKPAMKEVLREAGIPCAQAARVRSPGEARAFAAAVGFPVIIKPTAGAGAAGTYRADDGEQLERVILDSGLRDGAEAAAEEFIEGHEGFLDTLTVDGVIAHEFVTHYYPNVLDAMRSRWISPQMVATNRIDEAGYQEVRGLARKVIEVLGIETSATHMEWFFGPKGLKFSEIGCRPPGVCHWDVYNAANEMDLYRDWASAIVHGRCEQTPTRRYAAGMIALRPDRDGRIVGYDGLDDVRRRYGDAIVADYFPPFGTATQGVEGGYMANAWMRLRYPDYDVLRSVLDDIGETVQVRAG